MSDSAAALFDIVFRGDILPGQNIVQVKQGLAQLFKADAAKIDALFSGAATPLKRNLDKATADKYAAVLRKAGADVQVTAAGKVSTKTVPKRPSRPAPIDDPSASNSASNSASASASNSKPQTLQQRLAAQEQEQKQEQQAAQLAEKPEEPSKFSLAPVGTDVLSPEERSHIEPVVVDTSDLSLRESGSDLLDASEKSVIDPVEVDLSEFVLDEVGADLLSEDEKSHFEELELDLSGLDVAPAGSDMGAIKKPPPPPPPDTSTISLED